MKGLINSKWSINTAILMVTAVIAFYRTFPTHMTFRLCSEELEKSETHRGSRTPMWDLGRGDYSYMEGCMQSLPNSRLCYPHLWQELN